LAKEKRNVSAAEENKAIFRRYVEEIAHQGNLELADEIFDRYIAHQPDGSTLQRGPVREALLFYWGGLGAGGRHNPPYPKTFNFEPLTFGESTPSTKHLPSCPLKAHLCCAAT
jgi:hypothetical protein